MTTWGNTNPLGYLQGMNEIAAIIYLQLYSEIPKDKSHISYQFNHPDYLESDTYQILSRLFDISMKYMFAIEKPEKKKLNFLGDFMQNSGIGYSKDDIASNPVIKICHEVFGVYLKELDLELFEYLTERQIEPHIYML